jgi:phosphohistidine phosphatase SixA
MLRGGGYILAFRHGATNWNERDQDVLHYADRAGQRNLSETGRGLVTNLGKAIAALGIPIGDVHASPMWRCRDTATLAFGRCDTTSALFVKSREYRRIRWGLMSTAPAKGKNDVVVTHQDALIPITTLARDQLKEGEALVVKPLGIERGFRVVAQLAPMDWLRLAGAVGVEVRGYIAVPAARTEPAGSATAARDSTRSGFVSPDSTSAPAGSMGGTK